MREASNYWIVARLQTSEATHRHWNAAPFRHCTVQAVATQVVDQEFGGLPNWLGLQKEPSDDILEVPKTLFSRSVAEASGGKRK